MTLQRPLLGLLVGLLISGSARADSFIYLTVHNLGCRQANHFYTGFIYPHADWSEGDLVQIILAGPNRVIDPPLASGLPGGDDQLAVNSGAQFGMNMDSFTHANYTFYTPQAVLVQTAGYGPPNSLAPGVKWYVRAWNGASPGLSTAYYNSTRLRRDFPLPGESCALDSAVRTFPNDVTIPNFFTYAVTLEETGHPFVSSASVIVVEPQGGETLQVGGSTMLRWSANGAVTLVDVLLQRGSAGAWQYLFEDLPAADSAVNWAVTSPANNHCRMRVQWSADTTVFDLSDSVFMISAAPTLTLSEPQSYDTLTPGELISVAWNSSGLVTTVNILLRRGSVIAETLFAATENDGSESWVVTDPAADSVILRIESTSNPLSVFSEATGLSIHDTVFVGPLAAPEVVLLGGLNFVTIAWLPVPNAAAYRLEQSLDFMNWDSLTTATDTLIVVPVDSLAPILQYFRVIGVR